MTKKQPKKQKVAAEPKEETPVATVEDLDEQPNSGFGQYLRSQDGKINTIFHQLTLSFPQL